ncbi:MAG: DUF177 domain-containing protein [Demequinaceae bacterium]|nr:DUF177 domain-containing protein [Demequinaceae bacterium]
MEERVAHTPFNTSPFRISLRDIVRRPGTHQEYDHDFAVPERLGTDLIGVPQGSTVSLHVQCEVVTDGVWVNGTFTAVAEGECGRCLDDVSIDIEVPLQGLFLYPDAGYSAGDVEEDVYDFDGESLDLEEVITDAVVTTLPFTPLCDPGCPGLCDQCGVRLADNAGHAHEILDPRWSSLISVKDGLEPSDKEES